MHVFVRIALTLSLVLVWACQPAGDPRQTRFPSGREHFRLLRDGDFCGELPLFAEADSKTMMGTVLDGAQHYVDPKSGHIFAAIRVLTIVDARRVDHWYRREKLVGHVFVLKKDPRLQTCGYWMDTEKPVRPLPSEIPAD